MLSLVNGEYSDTWPVLDRGVQFGDGLFETMLCVQSTPMNFAAHWDRLATGCKRLRIIVPDIHDRVVEVIAESGLERGVAKLIVTRGSSSRGYRAGDSMQPNWMLRLDGLTDLPIDAYIEGVRLTVCETRLTMDPVLAGIKHLNRLPYVLARQEWNEEFYDGLLLDTEGNVIETCTNNLFIIRDGIVYTPDLSRAGVEGTFRRRVMVWLSAAGMAPSVGRLTLDDVLHADEVFVCNALRGAVPVRFINERIFSVGPLTTRISALLGEEARGESNKSKERACSLQHGH